MPPLIIFKGQRVQQYWIENCPFGIKLAAAPNGYITAKVFAEYGKFFLNWLMACGFLKADKADKFMVLLDGHYSHLFNLPYMEMMQKENVEVVAFPPHTTHVLQPLDNAPYANLKKM